MKRVNDRDENESMRHELNLVKKLKKGKITL